MTTQNYLMVENNVVTNCIVWDGDTQIWTPPENATMLVQATTPAMIWEAVSIDNQITNWVLAEKLGEGKINFTWNGTVCTTNEPKPEVPVQG